MSGAKLICRGLPWIRRRTDSTGRQEEVTSLRRATTALVSTCPILTTCPETTPPFRRWRVDLCGLVKSISKCLQVLPMKLNLILVRSPHSWRHEHLHSTRTTPNWIKQWMNSPSWVNLKTSRQPTLKKVSLLMISICLKLRNAPQCTLNRYRSSTRLSMMVSFPFNHLWVVIKKALEEPDP